MRTLITFVFGILTGAVATSAAGAWLFQEELNDDSGNGDFIPPADDVNDAPSVEVVDEDTDD